MDIKVGEYVRTNEGHIGKIVKEYTFKNGVVYPEPQEWVLDNGYILNEAAMYQMGEKIVNHSFNILELIQAGDYVNGHKVYESDVGLVIFNIDNFEYFVNPMGLELDKYRVVLEWQYKNYIKNVVTKEQFEHEKYIVGK